MRLPGTLPPAPYFSPNLHVVCPGCSCRLGLVKGAHRACRALGHMLGICWAPPAPQSLGEAPCALRPPTLSAYPTHRRPHRISHALQRPSPTAPPTTADHEPLHHPPQRTFHPLHHPPQHLQVHPTPTAPPTSAPTAHPQRTPCTYRSPYSAPTAHPMCLQKPLQRITGTYSAHCTATAPPTGTP